jgi:hypothetical protein
MNFFTSRFWSAFTHSAFFTQDPPSAPVHLFICPQMTLPDILPINASVCTMYSPSFLGYTPLETRGGDPDLDHLDRAVLSGTVGTPALQ